MAVKKETVKARREREAAEEKLQKELDIAQYPKRVMDLLEKVSIEGYDIKVVKGQFVVYGEDGGGYYRTYVINPEIVDYFDDMFGDFFDLNLELEEMAAKREKEKQKLVLRQVALSKLTADEIAALGLF